MIGVKRPCKLGTPRPLKSSKKKKLLKETVPSPDTENPNADYMKQKPSELTHVGPEELMEKVEVEVIDQGYQTDAESLFSSISSVTHEVLDRRDQLPHSMWLRYHELLRCATPEEQASEEPPSLTLLEEKYGHLVAKSFWYDRVVKLASTIVELGDGSKNVFDMTKHDLEEVAGHLVLLTEEEKEYLELLENYKKSKVQIDGVPTLQFLQKHHSTPPNQMEPESECEAEPTRYVDCCPVHEECEMKCLNPDQSNGVLFFKCPEPECCVFWTSDSGEAVRDQLRRAIHPSVHRGLLHTNLKCQCNVTPRMKLSRSEKNYGKVFLTCFKKNDPCKYFQWIHWKVREPKGPMDRYATILPFVEDEGQRQHKIL